LNRNHSPTSFFALAPVRTRGLGFGAESPLVLSSLTLLYHKKAPNPKIEG